MDIISLLPTKIPIELLEKVQAPNASRKEWLVYKSGWVSPTPLEPKIKAAEVHCTACGKSFWLERIVADDGCRYSGRSSGFFLPSGEPIYHSECCLCPECGHTVTAIHTSSYGNLKQTAIEYYFAMCFRKIGGEFAAISWRIGRMVDRNGQISWEVLPHEAYYTDGKKFKKAVGWYKYFMAIKYTGEWEPRAQCRDSFGRLDAFLPPEDEATTGTVFENAKLREYLDSEMLRFPVSYLKLYQKHKNAENLITAGAGDILTGLMADELQHYYYRGATCKVPLVDWSKKRPADMLHMNRGQLREFLSSIPPKRQAAAYEKWLQYRLCSEAKMMYLPELDEMNAYTIKQCIERKQEPLRVLRYVKQQRKRYPGDHVDCGELFDYWRFCGELGITLDQAEDRWPQRLKNAHDQMADELQRKKNKERHQKFKERLAFLEQFAWDDAGLMIRPAANETELKNEGRALHHCVATYAQMHASGETAIFFIRHKALPEQPYFTLELDEKSLTVRQNRGKHNCSRTPEVEAFEEKWLDHLKKFEKKGDKKTWKIKTA